MTTIIPSSLPPQLPPDQAWPEYLPAYDIVLDAERHAKERLDTNPLGREEQDNLIFARVTGFLLLELFKQREILTVEPCTSLALEIVPLPVGGGTTHDLVFDLGKRYCDHFVRTFRTSTKEYPTPSTHPSRPSFDSLEEMTAHFMKTDSKGYKAAKNRALARDGFRCMVTGRFSSSSLRKSGELLQKCIEQSAGVTDVQACHILGKSMMQDIEGKSAVPNKDKFASIAMAILQCFGHKDLADKLLAADGVHHLGNLLSLSAEMHSEFGSLGLWFEPTKVPNCYNVCTYFEGLRADLRRFGYLRQEGDRLLATFSSHITSAPPPDCTLLTLHAVCARVAHMSGAAQAIDELEQDVEEIRVLAFDGSSARLLDRLVAPFAAVSGVG